MENKTKRIGMCVFGVIFCGIAVGIFKLAAFGIDPFQTFMGGLNAVITINFGTLYVIANAILLMFALFTDRHYVNIATFVNMFLIGYIVDFSYKILASAFPDINMVGRIIALIIGIVIICFASSFYFVADLGVSTYDAVSLIIANTWKLIEFKYCRVIADLICVAIGFVLLLVAGASFSEIWAIIGIGTIITAFFMGPLIDFFVKKVARPFLEKNKQ